MYFLTFVIALELGITQNGYFWNSKDDNAQYVYANLFENPFYLNVDVEIDFWQLIFVRGSLKNYALLKETEVMGYPFHIDYMLSFGLHYSDFELGFRHYCNHPILAFQEAFNPFHLVSDSSYEEIFLKYKVKLEYFKIE